MKSMIMISMMRNMNIHNSNRISLDIVSGDITNAKIRETINKGIKIILIKLLSLLKKTKKITGRKKIKHLIFYLIFPKF